MKLPDVGEGVAEAELVEWFVEVGDEVTTDTVLAEVLTDKATVEVSAPVAGVVSVLHGEPGDVLAVGGELVEIDTGEDTGAHTSDATSPPPATVDDVGEQEAAPEEAAAGDPGDAARGGPDVPLEDVPAAPAPSAGAPLPAPDATTARRPLAAPAVRARAQSLGIELTGVPGSGPDGRILHDDLDRVLSAQPGGGVRAGPEEGHQHPVRGVRRRIAARLTDTWQQIPHITYVDGVDVTELEQLRAELARRADERGVRLTILAFVVRALTIACAEQPRLNAHYDHEHETLTTYDAVHAGIATQTDGGLLVPVVRDAQGRGLWDLARELARVTTAARDGDATRDELSGSTITITSLGAMGGLVTTPILNAPEVAIVGVNKIETRPVWGDGRFEPRRMLNLSSSFDHRMVDGWDAAVFVQRLKSLLETPSLLFLDDR